MWALEHRTHSGSRIIARSSHGPMRDLLVRVLRNRANATIDDEFVSEHYRLAATRARILGDEAPFAWLDPRGWEVFALVEVGDAEPLADGRRTKRRLVKAFSCPPDGAFAASSIAEAVSRSRVEAAGGDDPGPGFIGDPIDISRDRA